MNYDERFQCLYQELCNGHQTQPSVFECKSMLASIRKEIQNDEIIMTAMEQANTTKYPFYRTSYNAQGHTVQTPRMPSHKEIVEICFKIQSQIKEQIEAKREAAHNQKLLGSSDELQKQRKANGFLMCSLISHYGCCPEFTQNSIDNGVIAAPKDYMDLIKGGMKRQAHYEYLLDNFGQYIDICPKLKPKYSSTMPTIGMTLGNAALHNRTKEALISSQ